MAIYKFLLDMTVSSLFIGLLSHMTHLRQIELNRILMSSQFLVTAIGQCMGNFIQHLSISIVDNNGP